MGEAENSKCVHMSTICPGHLNSNKNIGDGSTWSIESLPETAPPTESDSFFDFLDIDDSPAETPITDEDKETSNTGRAKMKDVLTTPEQPNKKRKAQTLDDDDRRLTTVENMLLNSVGLEAIPQVFETLDLVKPQESQQRLEADQPLEIDESLAWDIVQVFFESTVYTLCPAVDETEFMTWYHSRMRRIIHSQLDEMVFQAILFAAFPYLPSAKLAKTPFGNNVAKGTRSLFRNARRLYHVQQAEHPGHRALVQTALLLTLWSPYDKSEREVNTFWADEAFHHARVGGLDKSHQPRDRILWWCVMTRTRTLALGLRRPHKLKYCDAGPVPTLCELQHEHHQHQNQRHQHRGDSCDDDHDVVAATAIAASFALASQRRKKTFAMQLFLKMCWLSEIMNSVVLLRHNTGRWDDWRCRMDGNGSGGGGNRDTAQGNNPILDTVSAIDQLVVQWLQSLEVLLAKNPSHHSSSRRCRVSIQMLRVMGLSTKAALYEQLLDYQDGSNAAMSWLLPSLASNAIKEVSRAITIEVDQLLEVALLEDIPLQLPAWIILPIAVHSVGGKSPCSLVYVLRQLGDRYSGAEYVSKLVDSMTRARATVAKDLRGDEYGSPAAEVEVLSYMTGIIRSALGLGVMVGEWNGMTR